MEDKKVVAYRIRQEHQKGVALLITLSVILLLSIALMKNFEKRSVEVAHLGNNLERFQAESLSRSVFRVILTVIKDQGLNTLLGNRSYWQEIDFSLGNGYFQIKEVTPIDHRFNLNKISSRIKDARIAVFKNMVRINLEMAGGYIQPSVNEPLSAIIDFTDENSIGDEVFSYDFEQYYREEPAFSVKNREFDRLSEVKLLPTFRALGFSADYLEENFRVLGDAEYIDVNLVNEKDLRDFLSRYDGVDGYSSLFDRQSDIWELIEKRRLSGNQSSVSGPLKIRAPFPAKRFGQVWNDALVASGITDLTQKEIDLFNYKSETLLIRFQVQVGKATVNIRSTVHIKYRKDSLKIEELGILSFRMI